MMLNHQGYRVSRITHLHVGVIEYHHTATSGISDYDPVEI